MKLKDFISSNEILLIAIGIIILFPLFSRAQVEDAQSTQLARLIQDQVNNPSSANYQVLLNTKKLNSFYSDDKFSYQPYWIDVSSMRPNSKAAALRKILKAAPEQGLWDIYWNANLETLFNSPNLAVADLADLDVKLSEAYLRYAHHVYVGRFDPRKFDDNIEMEPRQMPALMLRLKMVARNNQYDLVEKTNELLPKIPAYGNLKNALAKLRSIPDKTWPAIPAPGTDLFLGVRNPQVPAIRKRLAQLGYNVPVNGSDEFDAAVDKSLKDFQRNSSLKIDGRIGGKVSKVLKYLNVPFERRIKEIELNMERYRWLPRKLDTRYILVNVAMTKFTLRDDSLWKGDHWDPEISRLQFRTINGRDVRKTPLMIRKISRVEFNPTWTVPASIAIKDKLPILRQDPTYIDKHNMYLLVGGKVTSSASVNWATVTEDDFANQRYVIVQKPGYDNALGVVKFPLDGNSFNIYLHDTNERNLFEEENRHGSSGCVRLQRPLDLAVYLLKDQNYTMDSIKTIVPSATETTSRETKRVSLKKPITVFLHYLTVEAKSTGELGFADDDYEQDPKLLEALYNPLNNSEF